MNDKHKKDQNVDANPDNKSEKIKKIVKKYRSKIKDSSIYLEPDIPVSKLQNVLHSYAKEAVFEEALILIDNTFFGSATDGGLLTDQKIYAHNIFDEPLCFDFDEIETVEFREGDSKALFVNQLKFIEINFPDSPPMKAFAQLLREITYLYNPELKNIEYNVVDSPTPTTPPTPAKSPFESLKELKQLLDAGIITNAEFEEKKKKYLDKI